MSSAARDRTSTSRTADEEPDHLNKGREKKAVCVQEEKEEEFDIVEEAPDSPSDSSDNDGDDRDDETMVGRSPGLKVVLGLREGSSEMRERLRLIRQQSITFGDFFFHCLDWAMLGRFAIAMVAFFSASAAIFAVFVAIIFFVNEDQWTKYFPPDDDLSPSFAADLGLMGEDNENRLEL